MRVVLSTATGRVAAERFIKQASNVDANLGIANLHRRNQYGYRLPSTIERIVHAPHTCLYRKPLGGRILYRAAISRRSGKHRSTGGNVTVIGIVVAESIETEVVINPIANTSAESIMVIEFAANVQLLACNTDGYHQVIAKQLIMFVIN